MNKKILLVLLFLLAIPIGLSATLEFISAPDTAGYTYGFNSSGYDNSTYFDIPKLSYVSNATININRQNDWMMRQVDVIDNGTVGFQSSIFQSVDGNVHIVYNSNSSGNGWWSLIYAVINKTDGLIYSEVVETDLDPTPLIMGIYPHDIVNTSDGVVHIFYGDTDYDLKHAYGNFGGWSSEVVDSSSLITGYDAVAMVDASDNITVVYRDQQDDDLEFAILNDSDSTWYFETLSDDAATPGSVTSDATLASDGTINIVWHNSSGLTYINGTIGDWQYYHLSSFYGEYASITESSDNNISIASGISPNRALNHMFLNKTDGSWYIENITAERVYDVDIVSDNGGNNHIFYRPYNTTSTRRKLNHAAGTYGSWTSEIINELETTGYRPSAFFLDNDLHTVSAYRHDTTDYLHSALIYTRNVSTTISNIIIDVGEDGVAEFNTTATFNTNNQTGDFATYIRDYVDNTCSVPNCQVPVNVSINDTGTVQIHNMDIIYIPADLEINASDITYPFTTEEFDLGVTYNSSLYSSVNATLYWNGTAYGTTTTAISSGYESFNVGILMPLVNTNQNITWYWVVTVDGETSATEFFYQTLTNFFVDDCSDATEIVFNVTVWDERNASLKKTAAIDVNFDVFTMNSTVVDKTFSYESSEKFMHYFCMFPNASLIYTNVEMYYWDAAELYAPRNYYLYNTSFNGTTENTSIYMLNDTKSTSFNLLVLDSNMLKLEEAYIQTQRYYVGEDLYRTVEVSRTDEFGRSINHLELENPYYRYTIAHMGDVVYSGSPSKAYCSVNPCEMEFITGIEDVLYPFEGYEGVQYSLTFNDTGNDNIRYDYVDTTGTTQNGRLHVYSRGIISDTTICDTTTSSPAATILCDVSMYSNQSYTMFADAYIQRSPERLHSQLIVDFLQDWKYFGNEGLFWAILLILAISLTAIWNPAATIIMTVFAVIMLYLLGIVALPYTTVLAVIVIAIMLVWRMKS